jgi:hypothetical protein
MTFRIWRLGSFTFDLGKLPKVTKSFPIWLACYFNYFESWETLSFQSGGTRALLSDLKGAEWMDLTIYG